MLVLHSTVIAFVNQLQSFMALFINRHYTNNVIAVICSDRASMVLPDVGPCVLVFTTKMITLSTEVMQPAAYNYSHIRRCSNRTGDQAHTVFYFT